MTYVLVFGLYVLVLASIGFASRRSLGMPTLALAAGAVLAGLWADDIAPLVASVGLVLTSPPLASVVAVSLTLLPAIIVMLRAPKAGAMVRSIVSSVVFAGLAAMLTFDAFNNSVILDEASRSAAELLTTYRPIVTTVCIVVALVEIMTHRKAAPATDKKHKK